jgi:hypothetical protein
VEWKTGIGGAKASYEMVFECANSAFGGVSTVIVWGCELEGNVVIL